MTNDRERARLFADVAEEIGRSVGELGPPLTDERIEETARFAIRRVVGRAVGRRPVPVVQVTRSS